MKKLFIAALATALSLPVFSQNPYVAFAVGYMPQKNNTGYLSAEVTAGAHIGKSWCIEYNQNISLSSDQIAPKYIQLRTGPVINLNQQFSLYTVAGYSITSVPCNTYHKVGHGVTAAFYLVQRICKDFQIKYEFSVNNGFQLVPSIGARLSF